MWFCNGIIPKINIDLDLLLVRSEYAVNIISKINLGQGHDIRIKFARESTHSPAEREIIIIILNYLIVSSLHYVKALYSYK